MTTYSTQEIFNSKYPDLDLREYFEFIQERSLPAKIKFETANHHILPRWAFPEFSSLKKNAWNCAILSHIDHLKAHILLAKLWGVLENTSCVLRLTDGRVDITQLDERWFQSYGETMKQNNINISVLNRGSKRTIEQRKRLTDALLSYYVDLRDRGEPHLSENGVCSISTAVHNRNKRTIEDGTHPFLKRDDGSSVASEMSARGRLHFQKPGVASSISITTNSRRVREGTHNFLDREMASERSRNRVSRGEHNFLGKNMVTLVDKNGDGRRLDISVLNFWKASGLPMSEWEYVSIASNEAKRRRMEKITYQR